MTSPFVKIGGDVCPFSEKRKAVLLIGVRLAVFDVALFDVWYCST